MKITLLLMLNLLAWELPLLSSDIELDRSDKFQNLISSCPSQEKSTPLLDRIWNMEMDKLPNANDRLIDLLHDYRLNGARGEQLQIILWALYKRKDLNSEQLTRLTKPLWEMKLPQQLMDFETGSYVYGVINIMRDYPTEEHVNLALKFLESYESLSKSAFYLLSEIGDEKIFRRLEDFMEDFRKANEGYVNWGILPLEEHLSDMSRRLARDGKLPGSAIRVPITVEEARQGIQLKKTKTTLLPNVQVSSDKSASSEFSAWSVIALCFVLIGLIHTLLRLSAAKKKVS